MPSTGDGDLPASPEHRYFQAIEEAFLLLRGSPLTLSPTDWRVARGWFEAGIPVELVVRALEEVLERRRERGARGRVSSLRYCASAVEAAWQRLRELEGPGARPAGTPPLDVAARLAEISGGLPAILPGRAGWEERVRGLGGRAGDVEVALARLDDEMLAALLAALPAAEREEVEREVEETAARVAAGLSSEDRARLAVSLRRRLLRRRWSLRPLSLFEEG